MLSAKKPKTTHACLFTEPHILHCINILSPVQLHFFGILQAESPVQNKPALKSSAFKNTHRNIHTYANIQSALYVFYMCNVYNVCYIFLRSCIFYKPFLLNCRIVIILLDLVPLVLLFFYCKPIKTLKQQENLSHFVSLLCIRL